MLLYHSPICKSTFCTLYMHLIFYILQARFLATYLHNTQFTKHMNIKLGINNQPYPESIFKKSNTNGKAVP